MRAPIAVGLLIFGVLTVVAAILAVVFLPFLDGSGVAADLAVAAPVQGVLVAPRPAYLPPRATEAPLAILPQVLSGQQRMLARSRKGESFRRLACSSCHFFGGLSEGGKNGGFSLVGVAARYPDKQPEVGLKARIAGCYRKNLNVRPPDADSSEMVDIDTYLRWISDGVPFMSQVPWLQTAPLVGSHGPDVTAGERTWRETCSPCHGDNGEGTRIAPAVYGADSFTRESQILAPGILERFIHDNMPRGNPHLGEAAAIDVAAFLRKQPRPSAAAL